MTQPKKSSRNEKEKNLNTVKEKRKKNRYLNLSLFEGLTRSCFMIRETAATMKEHKSPVTINRSGRRVEMGRSVEK